jgi:C-terminal processing protease CtpA/Prc
VALLWNVFQHFYPYFDVVQTDWPAELRRALQAAATDRDATAFQRTLERLVAALHDGHGGVYLTGGMGGQRTELPLVWEWVEDKLVITALRGDVPGLKRGDVVLKIDGKPAAEVLREAEAFISGATPQWKRYRALNVIRSGAAGATVALEVKSGDNQPATVKLIRQGGGMAAFREPRPDPVAELKPGIFYVDIDRVKEEDFKNAVPKLAEAKGIVFDLRGYPTISTKPLAHLTDEPITCARWNIPEVVRPDREGMTFAFSNWTVAPQSPRFKGKIAFLTDGRAISYAETYLGIVEHYKLADIVGGPTAGTNGNVNPISLPGDYRVMWTGMKVLKHDGSRHHGVGIQPTVPATRTIRGIADGKDEVLEKAIEVVSR